MGWWFQITSGRTETTKRAKLSSPTISFVSFRVFGGRLFSRETLNTRTTRNPPLRTYKHTNKNEDTKQNVSGSPVDSTVSRGSGRRTPKTGTAYIPLTHTGSSYRFQISNHTKGRNCAERTGLLDWTRWNPYTKVIVLILPNFRRG